MRNGITLVEVLDEMIEGYMRAICDGRLHKVSELRLWQAAVRRLEVARASVLAASNGRTGA